VSWFDLRMMSAVALLRSGGSWISALALQVPPSLPVIVVPPCLLWYAVLNHMQDDVLWTGNFQGTLCRFDLSVAQSGLPEVPHEDAPGRASPYHFLRLDRKPHSDVPPPPLPVSGLPEYSPSLRVQGCGYVRSLHLSPARLVAGMDRHFFPCLCTVLMFFGSWMGRRDRNSLAAGARSAAVLGK
jgi:hypothetical protein